MKRFIYDVVKLIEAVRDRPCIWNKRLENYKDRIERKDAWNEIYNILDEKYDEMSSDEQRLISEMIIGKWTNIRDTFVKTVKKKGKTGRHYVLYDHLKFLLDILPISNHDQDNLGFTDDHSGYIDDNVKDSGERKSIEHVYEDLDESSDEETLIYKPSSSKKRKYKKEYNNDEITITNELPIGTTPDFVSVDEHRIMNEDEAFFASLLPSVVKYSEEERLEFRIEVLAVMKKISDKRKSMY